MSQIINLSETHPARQIWSVSFHTVPGIYVREEPGLVQLGMAMRRRGQDDPFGESKLFNQLGHLT